MPALGVGLLIGIERGWTERDEDEGDRIAGIRTFSLVGLLGGLSAKLTNFANEWILGVVLLAFAAPRHSASVRPEEAVRRQDTDIGITTRNCAATDLCTWCMGRVRIRRVRSGNCCAGDESAKPETGATPLAKGD
ncbi:MAG: MgtC/SapB family protein [Balneolaceae bacterium]|nr:MgtC/SapB family protein [Balneolaceae bacterium]